MKIIFLNTWHGKLRDELRAYITRHMKNTAVFCFQEAYSKERVAYEDLLADQYSLHSVQRAQGSSGNWYGNAIYVRNDITITETGALFTDDTDGFDVGLAAFLTLKIGEKKLTICNVHGIPYPGDKLDNAARLYQSQTIIDTFAGQQSVVIGGDFNLLPHTKSIQTFSENGYQDLIADFDIKTTRNRITFDHYPDNIQYFADFAFVSPNIEVVDFAVPSGIVSDHQPLELQVNIEGLQETFNETDTAEASVF